MEEIHKPVCMVEDIESFSPELQTKSFGNSEVLEN
jgi:hypothetical protein